MPTKRHFGEWVRRCRERKRRGDAEFSLNKFSARVGMSSTFLSDVERGRSDPPSEEKIRAIARELGEDPDDALGRAGRVASDLLSIVMDKPVAWGNLIRAARDVPVGKDGLTTLTDWLGDTQFVAVLRIKGSRGPAGRRDAWQKLRLPDWQLDAQQE
ncbi:MAG: helix-turn-helix transcriptional regulator [Lentisphaerae bacterium]|nr:helix-turn-helix transcriptional regulator [Lentisphaerota bacterium]